MTVRYSNIGQRLPIFTQNLAAALKGSMKTAPGIPDVNVDSPGNAANVIGELQVRPRSDGTSIGFGREAVRREEKMGPPSGPPSLVKPSHELLGEILLRAGKPNEAAEQFKIALLRQPNRARSLLGIARAAAKMGDQRGAMSAYARLSEQWRNADKEIPELLEAQNFLKQARF